MFWEIINEEARKKLEHMGQEVPEQHECEKKTECSPTVRRDSESTNLRLAGYIVRNEKCDGDL
jgi:hypothetical protein